MVDALDLKFSSLESIGSNPIVGNTNIILNKVNELLFIKILYFY
jgi:hypothetical protein